MVSLDWKMLKAVYQAGIRRGNDEASAYDWGTSPSGGEYDNLAEAIHDTVNDGKDYASLGYHSWDSVEAWVKTQLAQK